MEPWAIEGIVMHVPRGFEGGPETFFSLSWTGHISSYDSLSSHLNFRHSPASYETDFAHAVSAPTASFPDIFTKFLKGSGIPCPGIFVEVRGHISNVVNLTGIDQPGFCSRMLCWAATGLPSVELSGTAINVCIRAAVMSVIILLTISQIFFIPDNDDSYAATDMPAAMITGGKICFKTCYTQAHIPAQYLISLAKGSYTASTEPHSLHDAIHHWLLAKILTTIRNHSIARDCPQVIIIYSCTWSWSVVMAHH